MRYVAVIEEIASVKDTVAQELVGGTVKFVRAVRGDNVDLRSRPLPVFGAVGVLYYRKFTHGIHSQELSAYSTRRVVDLGCAGEFNSIQQEEIFLRPAAGDGEHVSDNGVRSANSSGALGCVVDDSRIQGQQLVVAPSVQRQVLHLTFANQAGDVFSGDLDIGRDSGDL